MTRAASFLAACFALSVAPAPGQEATPSPAPSARRGPAARPSVSPAPTPAGAAVSALSLKPLKARAIGPAVMGGRVSDIAFDPGDPATYYVALGTGGVMKTADGGASFEGVFEKQPVAAIGAVAVAPSDAKVVWVGTGEANDRNSSSWGNGVYRSTDSGGKWTHAGLTNSKTIARIVVHPTDAATAWVAAMGDLWNPSPERGLYKTTDAGKTWKAVLVAPAPYGDRVGAGDVAIDPKDPNTLYAALYARRRTPWSFAFGPSYTDGKDQGGIFKSTDGGSTWRKLTRGLPGATGRIGLAVHAKDPRIVYAIVHSEEGGYASTDDVQSKRGGVFRSDDAGESWRRVNALNPRPFYFSQIRVDPADDKRIYVLGFALHVSEDAGKTFREDRFGKVHPDNHALAIDQKNPKHLLLGTDGGIYESWNGGENWDHQSRIAAGEFYRINVDSGAPYRICGGLQDNVNWVGPSRTRTKDGIVNADWINVGGGDGFYCVFDPEKPNLVYTESQSGTVFRMDLVTGQVKNLRPEPAEGQTAFRFHWNSPLIASAHARGTLYLAGNRVFRLTNRGEHWQAVSPDLSTQDPQKTNTVGSGAETYGVVYSLAESPVKAGLLWAATDDGKLWVTEDDGGHWTDLTASLPGPAKGQWLSRIEPGHQDAHVAYLAVDAHRTAHYGPLAFRTADGGRTWEPIASDLPVDGPVKVVREDPFNPSLLYAGTEFGLFGSLDRGAHWARLGEIPTVAVDDILVHPRDRDLVVATHGRSLYIFDDVRALEELTPEVRAKEAHLFPPPPATGVHLLPGFADWAGTSGTYRGDNPPEGVLFTYWLKAYTGEPVKITVTGPNGVTVAKLSATAAPGLGRVSWDLKPTSDLLTEYGGEGKKFVPAGEYKVVLSYGEAKSEQKLTVDIPAGVETR